MDALVTYDTQHLRHTQPPPCFILIESKEEDRKNYITFAILIENVIIGIMGELKSIKTLHNAGQHLIGVSKNNLFITIKFYSLKISPLLPLNTLKGIVCRLDLKELSDDEIREKLKQEVFHIKRLNVKPNGTIFLTNTFVFSFKHIKKAGLYQNWIPSMQSGYIN